MIEMAFDIGAYNGNSIERIKKLGYKKLVCVEPTPSSYQQLINNFKIDENLIALNMAITEKDNDNIDFYVNDIYPFLNTIDKEWITDTRHKFLVNEKNLNKINIKTTTISEMIKKYGKPGYIKIDVEGKELSVLKSFEEKIDLLSFEYIAELIDSNIACLERCSEIGYFDFYISFNEEFPIFLEDKSDQIEDSTLKQIYFNKYDLKTAKDVMNMLKKYDTQNCIWGNVWCK